MIRLVAYITIICWLAVIGAGWVLYHVTPVLTELVTDNWQSLRWLLYAATLVIIAGGARDCLRSLRLDTIDHEEDR
jgi:hypothetical protein